MHAFISGFPQSPLEYLRSLFLPHFFFFHFLHTLGRLLEGKIKKQKHSSNMYVNGLAAGSGLLPFKAANVQSSHINTEGKIKSRWKGQAPAVTRSNVGGLGGVRRIADVMMGNQRWESRIFLQWFHRTAGLINTVCLPYPHVRLFSPRQVSLCS